jgi:hypothetical protein
MVALLVWQLWTHSPSESASLHGVHRRHLIKLQYGIATLGSSPSVRRHRVDQCLERPEVGGECLTPR